MNEEVPPLRLGVLVTGSRDWRWPRVLNGLIDWPHGPITLIHGGADGADKQMVRHAADQGWNVLPAFLPDYRTLPRRIAPLARNDRMVDALQRMYQERQIDLALCVALWRDHSGGTGYTRDAAAALRIPVVTRYDCACHTLTGVLRSTVTTTTGGTR